MEKTIVAATGNKHKIKEIEAITAEFGMSIISKDEAGVPDVEIVEDGETFEENSYKKAYEIMKLCGRTTIADDSGLVVDCLNGAPGVYSARFAGTDGDDDANNRKLIGLIKDVPVRKPDSPVRLGDNDGIPRWTVHRCQGGSGRSSDHGKAGT